MNQYRYAPISLLIILVLFFPRIVAATTFNVPPDPFPSTLNSGDILNISGSVSLPDGFSAASGSQVNLLSGAQLDFLFTNGNVHLFPGSVIPGPFGITGGYLLNDGGSLTGISGIGGGAHAEILDGSVDTFFSNTAIITFRGGTLGGGDYQSTAFNLLGGDILPGGTQFRDSVFAMRGGSIANGPTNEFGMTRGEFHFYMRSALLDGAPIPGLSMGGTATISSRNVTLSGQLENGAALNYVIRARSALVGISTQTTVKVSLVPEPACNAALLGGAAIIGASWRRRKPRVS